MMVPTEEAKMELVWVWFVIAILFFLGEVLTAGFVLAAFGVGALVAMLAALLGTTLPVQLIVFIVTSGTGVLLSRRFADRITGPQAQGVGIDRVLGKRAVVLEAIDPMTASGMVRVEREEWRADTVDNLPVPAGAVVEVLAVEGTRLKVRQVPGDEPSAAAA
jgi:membrane protein implicated in regulation of membrane protease activity